MRGKDREPADTGCTDGITPAYAGKSSYTTAAESEENRITPAYAGKSMELSSNIMVSKDHPRLCGEKASTKAWELWGTGSPPPMRGKVRNAVYGVFVFRITPAYAGKRQTVISSDVAKRDHPRLCGEKFLCRSGRMSSTGSPPPMRGKVRWRTRLLPRSGINVINLTSSQAS